MIVLLSFNYCALDDAAICAGPSNYESLHCLTSFGGFQRVSLNIKEWKCILSFFTVYLDLHELLLQSVCAKLAMQRWSCNFGFRTKTTKTSFFPPSAVLKHFHDLVSLSKETFAFLVLHRRWKPFLHNNFLGRKQKNVQWRFTSCTRRSVPCVSSTSCNYVRSLCGHKLLPNNIRTLMMPVQAMSDLKSSSDWTGAFWQHHPTKKAGLYSLLFLLCTCGMMLL